MAGKGPGRGPGQIVGKGPDRVKGGERGPALVLRPGAKNPRVMALAVHPYISGVPHRIKYFEAVYDYMRKKPGVWMTTGEEIYEWYRQSRR